MSDRVPVIADWEGREQSADDVITAAPATRLSATLAEAAREYQTGDVLPHGWHWLYFLEAPPLSTLTPDGHPPRGGFLPPVALPRRMWAGSALRFHAPLCIGDRLRKLSRIVRVQEKQGRSGRLVFVTICHTIMRDDVLLLEEEQTIVYREAAAPDQNCQQRQPAESDQAGARHSADVVRRLEPHPALLFRYSALTFNTHRIHYDRRYAIEEEGYPGLVVQGPLSATLLLQLVLENYPQDQLEHFGFRNVRPLVDEGPFFVCANRSAEQFDLWVEDAAGRIAVQAAARLSDSPEAQ